MNDDKPFSATFCLGKLFFALEKLSLELASLLGIVICLNKAKSCNKDEKLL